MPLATEEEEKFLEVQEWASSIFAAPGRARNLARKQADAAAALTRTCPDGASTWPSADQSTASLAMQLDSGPVRRRSTHGIRSLVRDALRWTDHGRMASVRLADSLANSAVALHTPTSAIRSLCSLARVNVGLWSAVRNGSLPKHVALTGTEGQLSAFGSSYEAYVKDEELAVWKDWLITEDAQVNVDIEDTFALVEDAEKSQMEMETTKVSKMNSLRAYQKSALEAVGNASPKNCCVVLPCGAGKTRLGAALTWDFLQLHPAGCIIVLCLRREGIRQWKRELLQNWGIVAFEAGASQSGETLPSCQVILVTYHRMLCERRRALAEMSRLHEAGEEHVDEVAGSIAARLSSADEALLIADECHMVPAPKICELLASMLNHHSRRLVGLTATLLRESGVNKDDEDEGEVPWPLLGNCVFRETFANLAPEYLAPVQCIEVSVPVVGEWRKIFKRQQLAPAVCLSGGKWLVLERLLAKHANDSLLITVERCEQARQIASMFGIIPIDGTVPPAQMKDYLERFRQRKILALVATHVLDDSADFPELFVMIQMAGHFASRRQEQQRLGRLLRWGPVKRRRWEETSARPTFYVLVHKGTVEERMSRHRTRSVLGVSYENVDANSLMKSPESALGEGSAFFQRKRLCSSFRELDQQYETALGKTLSDCVELSRRVAKSMLRGKKCREAKLSEIRRWLRGESSPGTQDPDDEVLVSSSESGSSPSTRDPSSGDSGSSSASSSTSKSSSASSSLSTDSSKSKAKTAKAKSAQRTGRKTATKSKSKPLNNEAPRGRSSRGRGRGDRGRGTPAKGAENQDGLNEAVEPSKQTEASLGGNSNCGQKREDLESDVLSEPPRKFACLRPAMNLEIDIESD